MRSPIAANPPATPPAILPVCEPLWVDGDVGNAACVVVDRGEADVEGVETDELVAGGLAAKSGLFPIVSKCLLTPKKVNGTMYPP